MSGGENGPSRTNASAQDSHGPNRRGRFDWRQVGIVYRRELRAALRERSIVVNSILLPLFLYPFILWAAFTGMMFVQGQTEKVHSRVVVEDWPKGHPALRRAFAQDKKVELEKSAGTTADARKLKLGALDAVVQFRPAAGTNAALAGNFQARIRYNESSERSSKAHERVAALIRDYRTDWIKRQARSLGITPSRWEGFTFSAQNVASKKQMGAYFLSLLVPVLFVVMVAVGCFYPAVDATAGERERHTWETLMSTAANRVNIAAAKYLYVTTLGGLAGALNLFAVIVTIKPILAPLLGRAGDIIQFTVPLSSLPVMALAAVLLAGFVAAGMMIFAAFARTFREGQAMITPFYLVVLLPVMFVQMPGLKFSLALACAPIVNIVMMLRAAISHTLGWAQFGVTVAVSLVLIVLCIRLAAFILQFEDVVIGSQRGGLRGFIRQRILKRTNPATLGPEQSP